MFGASLYLSLWNISLLSVATTTFTFPTVGCRLSSLASITTHADVPKPSSLGAITMFSFLLKIYLSWWGTKYLAQSRWLFHSNRRFRLPCLFLTQCQLDCKPGKYDCKGLLEAFNCF